MENTEQNLTALAGNYIELLGGKENIQTIDACVTRLRVLLHDNHMVTEEKFKELGAYGIMKAGDQAVQVIVKHETQKLAAEMKKIIKG